MSSIILADQDSIQKAADKIKKGEIVVLPTETVYGLGADATNTKAVQKIFDAKQRPAINPLIIHVVDKSDVDLYAEQNEISKRLIEIFWPGPLTLILKSKASHISPLVTAGLETIAIRMPEHPVMSQVIEKVGSPIAAPSANKSGEPSATTPKDAAASLGDSVDMILAAGKCDVGLESTVIDISDDIPTILRPGAISQKQIQEALNIQIEVNESSSNKPKSPGQLLKHYAPSIPVRLNAVDVKEGEALLAFGSLKFMGIEGGGFAKDLPDHQIMNLSEATDLDEAARNLFTMLRALDKPEFKAIAVMNIPDENIGIAINERLKRAAQQ
ncbi:MAG: L-threonylcarbamoyladenylate synthase [Pseudomonadota bacterium]